MKTTITGGQGWPPEASSNRGVLPGLPSLTSSIDRSPTLLDTMRPPPPQSQQLGPRSLHSPIAAASRSGSFDGSASYNPRPGDSVQSSKDIPPSRPYEMPPNRGKLRRKTNYMSHPQLALASTAAPSTVLWDNAVLPAASQYPQYEAGFDKEVDPS